MFLRRVALTGFKSFAGKTVIELAPGLTAVVGPNGSGKSNLADAVRWAFGEQSRTKLRLEDRQDVVFAGTATKPRASMAEVSLVFDNEDGAFPLELSEVEITRRLYRSGESEFLLAGRSVRQSDIQSLMTHAGVGVGTYAVVGQGMIDSLLVSTPSERKLLFDEAAGIRGPELKRAQAVRKLEQANDNIVRLRDIVAEIEPRLNSLTKLMQAGEMKRLQAERVTTLTREHALARASHAQERKRKLNGQLGALRSRLDALSSERNSLAAERAAAEKRETTERAKIASLAAQIQSLEGERDKVALQLADTRGAISAATTLSDTYQALDAQIARSRAALHAAQERHAELTAEQSQSKESAVLATRALERATAAVAKAQNELLAHRKSDEDGTRDQYVDHALQIIKTLAVSLQSQQLEWQNVRLLVHKAGRLLSHASRASDAPTLEALQSAQKHLEAAMVKRETAAEHLTNIMITSRSIEIDLTHQTHEVERLAAEVQDLTSRLDDTQASSADVAVLRQDEQHTTMRLGQLTQSLEATRSELRAVEEPAKSSHIAKLAVQHEQVESQLRAAGVQHQQLEEEIEAAEEALREALHGLTELGLKPNLDIDIDAAGLASLEHQLIQASAQLDALSRADTANAEEYESVRERHAQLTSQIADLESAIADLGKIIGGLDELIRDRFKQNFDQLSVHFSEYFNLLFHGGAAALALTRGQDGEYGVGIQVSPNGKRPTSIGALSGGERALAGTALIAAILRSSPSPFVVLDEIDAALDESNSTRLSEIFAQLRQISQVIVITHNRQTMQAADVIFGVTTDEHHTSRIISMRLEEADKLAAR